MIVLPSRSNEKERSDLKGRFGGDSSVINKLNLPRIAMQSILGLNRRRLGIVNAFTLHSTCSIYLCYTEQLSSLNTDRTADIGKSLDSHLFKEQPDLLLYFSILI